MLYDEVGNGILKVNSPVCVGKPLHLFLMDGSPKKEVALIPERDTLKVVSVMLKIRLWTT